MPRGVARLVTIPYSHFCEKARWALDRAGLAYVEEPHAPGLHRFYTRRLGARGSVPVLVTEGGAVVDDSQRILEHVGDAAKLFPADAALRAEVDAWCVRFDKELGPDARRVAYHDVLTRPGDAIPVLRAGAPGWEGALMRPLFPFVRSLMRRTMRIDHDGAERSRLRVIGVFADVDALLEGGRRYLVGDAFSAADLTFAALAAPIVMPPQYAARFPGERGSAELQSICVPLRESRAGRHAARLYAEERDVTLAA